MKLIVFLLFTSIMYADTYPHFTEKQILDIKTNNGSISKNRVLDYTKNITKIKNLPQEKKLNSLNFYLNQLLPQYDDIINKKENHWATPKEFLIAGYGDCEDYVIIKYFSLIKLGFDERKLFMTVVKEKYYGQHHMVLSYFESKQKSPLVLDNLSFKILRLKKRKDLEAEIFINPTGVYRLEKNSLVKIAHKSLELSELLERIKRED